MYASVFFLMLASDLRKRKKIVPFFFLKKYRVFKNVLQIMIDCLYYANAEIFS